MILAAITVMAVSAQAQPRVDPPAGLMDIVWTQSQEYAGPDTSTWRPKDYPMTRARGPLSTRRFDKDGTVRMTGPGPTDAEIVSVSEWRMIATGRFAMRDRTPSAPWSNYEIVTLTKDQLVIRGPLRTP